MPNHSKVMSVKYLANSVKVPFLPLSPVPLYASLCLFLSIYALLLCISVVLPSLLAANNINTVISYYFKINENLFFHKHLFPPRGYR